MRKAIPATTLMRLRQMPGDTALQLLSLYCKADASYKPIRDPESRRWHVRTDCGEFEILMTGIKWYDPRAKIGGGGAIDLAMHILQVPFVDAVKVLTSGTTPRG
jgi:hypothetical protein